MKNSHKHCPTCTCLQAVDTFIRTCLTRKSDALTPVAQIYTAYCIQTDGQPAITQNQFTRRLRVLGYNLTPYRGGNRIVAHTLDIPEDIDFPAS